MLHIEKDLQTTDSKPLKNNLAAFDNLRSTSINTLTVAHELKQLNSNSETYWYELGSRLLQIRIHRSYHQQGYRSFSDYCQREIGYSRQHVYKLIKAVEFIDLKWRQAETDKQKEIVNRLFNLGFTKLYYLLQLPSAELQQLIEDGLTVTGRFNLPIENLPVNKLKKLRISNHKPVFDKAGEEGLFNPANIKIAINSQCRSLLLMVEQCQQNLNNGESIVNELRICNEQAHTILEAVKALAEYQNYL